MRMPDTSFLHDGIDLVQLALQFGEHWICFPETPCKATHNERKSAQYNQSELTIQTKQEENAAKHQHSGAEHTPDKLGDEVLYLCNVIGYSRYQRTGAELVHLGKGKGHNVPKNILTHFVSDVLSRHVDKHIVQRAAEAAKENKTDHFQSKKPDQLHISHVASVDTQNTVIHDAAHDLWLQQIHQHLADHKQRSENGKRKISLYIFPHFKHPLSF